MVACYLSIAALNYELGIRVGQPVDGAGLVCRDAPDSPQACRGGGGPAAASHRPWMVTTLLGFVANVLSFVAAAVFGCACVSTGKMVNAGADPEAQGRQALGPWKRGSHR